MRIVFGVLSLLLALAIVAVVARQAMRPAAVTPAAPAGGMALSGPDPASQAQATAEQVRRALAEAAGAAQRQRDAAEQN